jgi:hypothetical protein
MTSKLTNEDHLKFRVHLNGSVLGGALFGYFDIPKVRELLHVSPDAAPEYEDVNYNVTYAYRPQFEGSSWVYDILLGKYSQYKALNIHGNTDALLSTPGVWDVI